MPTSAPGSNGIGSRRRASGFTLLELMVVVAIVAIASAGVALVLRDATGASLEREGQRLGALLESARAKSRLTGTPVRWVADPEGFHFEGLATDTLPHAWLAPETRVVGRAVLLLGPEPIIGPQAVVITSTEHPEQVLRIATDGVRPFAVMAAPP
jgi:general secretion pathway protein H